MTPAELRVAARALIDEPPSDLVGVWPRAAALLARQALEHEINAVIAARAPGLESCSMRARLVCLGEVIGDEQTAARVAHSWGILSRATHAHDHELSPSAIELEPHL